MTPLYLDVHVPAGIAAELRRRDIDVLTAQEDGTAEWKDDALLDHAAVLGRLLFARDIRFKALAEEWQRKARHFAGLVFGHQLHGSIGQYIRDLELIAKATDPADWVGQVEQLPLR